MDKRHFFDVNQRGGVTDNSIPSRSHDAPRLTEFCINCRAIPWYSLLRRESIIPNLSDTTDPTYYLGTIDSLLKSQHSCCLCDKVVQGVELESSISEAQSLDSDTGVTLTISMSTSDTYLPIINPSMRQYAMARFRFRWMSKLAEATLRISVLEGDPLAQDILGRVVWEDPLSPHAFQRLDSMIEFCVKNHEICRSGSESALLPTRVLDLDVSSPNTVCLFESVGNRDRYVALSHCWGKSQTFTTTTGTISARKSGINVSELPKTFSDAILITRRLGLRYLWIDSLCIIQDDKDDWRKEAATMGSVYSNAYLTIAASNSTADSEGFLRPRAIPEFLSVLVTTPDGRPSIWFLTQKERGLETNTFRSVVDPLEHEPLTSRAWVIQERYLSRRSIFFGKRQMFWECQQCSAAEDGHLSELRLYSVSNLLSDALSSSPANVRVHGSQKYHGWYRMIERYSVCSITYGKDRFPALSALASTLAQPFQDEYCAGIWKGAMVEGLLWIGSRWTGWPTLVTKPESYRAPSWSWASVDGPVQFIPYLDCSLPAYKSCDFTKVAHVRNTHIEPDGGDRYGEIKAGWLSVEAPLLPMSVVEVVSPFGGKPAYQGERPFLLIFGDEKFFIQGNRSDPDMYEGPIVGIILAELKKGSPGMGEELSIDVSSYLYGLILKETDQRNAVFQRVGVFYGPLMREAPGPWHPNLRNEYINRMRRETLIPEGEIPLTKTVITIE